MTQPAKQTISRRRWLRQAADAGTAALPLIAPASALGLAGTTAPSERIGLGVIGTGSKANGGLRNFRGLGGAVELRGFCDPNDRVRQAAVGAIHRNRNRPFRHAISASCSTATTSTPC